MIEARVGDREPVRMELPEDFPRGRYVGVFVKDGECVLEDPVIEIYP